MEHGTEYIRKQNKIEKLYRIVSKMRQEHIDAQLTEKEDRSLESSRRVKAFEEEIQCIRNEIHELEHELKLLYRDEIRKFYFEQECLQP